MQWHIMQQWEEMIPHERWIPGHSLGGSGLGTRLRIKLQCHTMSCIYVCMWACAHVQTHIPTNMHGDNVYNKNPDSPSAQHTPSFATMDLYV